MKYVYFFAGMALQAFIAGTMSALHLIKLNAGQQLTAAFMFAAVAFILYKKAK